MIYDDLGYNSRLRKKTALKTTTTTGFDFDSQNERDVIRAVHLGAAVIGEAQIQDAAITAAKIGTAAIGTANIGTLSFNQISGGTAVLGGTVNGDGVLEVNNAGGTVVVRLNNTGILINSGTVTGVTIGTTIYSGGTINNTAIGTPTIIGGTYTNANLSSPTASNPTVTGTLAMPVNAGSAALGSEGAIAIQTHTGSAILAVRIGTITYRFFSGGTVI